MIPVPVLTYKLIVLSWIIARRQQIHDTTAQRNTWNKSYDFIVVGAGGAGCVVSSRLAEDPNNHVLLLEAGGAQDVIFTDIYWPTDFIEENRPDLHWHYYQESITRVGGQRPRNPIKFLAGKMIGGSTSINAMSYNRGNRRGFDRWEQEYGAVGWNYWDVMPYFLSAENNTDPNVIRKNPGYHNVHGPVQISTSKSLPKILKILTNVYNDLGYQNTDFNGPNQTGTSQIQLFVNTQGNRMSSGTAYVDPNPHPNNLHIVTRAHVTKIIFKGITAIGIEFVKNFIYYEVYAEKEVILSAGSLNTPQLLMLSGVGPKQHLEQHNIPVLMDLPVGNNLMDHPAIFLNSDIIDTRLFTQSRLLTNKQLAAYFLNHTGPLGNIPKIASMLSTSNNPDINFPNVYVSHSFNKVIPKLGVSGSGLITVIELTIVKSRGTVRLQSPNPFTLPIVDAKYYFEQVDYDNMIGSVRMIFYILESPKYGLGSLLRLKSFQSIGCPPCSRKYKYQCTEGLKCLILKRTSSSNHHGGSCRMGAVHRNDVVVDPQLRVKNLNNLRVCDASIFPELPNSNTCAAVMMIGEKCAKIVKDFYNNKNQG